MSATEYVARLRRCYTVREALQLAQVRGARLEATHPKPFGSRSAAENHKPRGGIVVHDEHGYTALQIIRRETSPTPERKP